MELGGNLARSAVRQSEENHIMMSEYFRRGLRHKPITERNQLWMVLAQKCSRTGARGDRPDFHVGVTK